eukprot:1150034-Pelagomonas_calceolata.AAC.3
MLPYDAQRSREQHHSKNGVSDKFIICVALQISAPLVMYAHALQVSKEQPPRQPDACTCKLETSGVFHCLSILQTVVTRLQTPCQKPQSPSGPRLIPFPKKVKGIDKT